jgi:hypothetical protein
MEWLHHVPDVVWAALSGAVVASGISLFTTILSNRNSRKQLRMQLQDNGLQRDRDRAMALRRDVYLPASEALTRMQAALGQLTDIGADQARIGRHISTGMGILYKAHLVANAPTVRALMAYQAAFMPVYLEVIMLRSSLVVHKMGIETQQKFIDRADAEYQRIVQIMKQHNIAGSTDRAAFERLNAQSVVELQALKTHSDKQSVLRSQLFAGQMALGEKLAEALAKTAAVLPDALISCRHELEMPIDDPIEYRSLFEQQQSAAREIMLEAVRGTRKLANAMSDPTATD